MTRIRFEDLPSTNTPINAENLNKLNNVIVSSEEPTTGEEVWLQKGKNLYNPANTKTQGNNAQNILLKYEKIKVGETYTFSTPYTWVTVHIYNSAKEIVRTFGNIENSYEQTFTIQDGEKYFTVMFYSGMNNVNLNDFDFTNVQLEQGNKTTYEPYINKKIHTKTDNGYEEFYNEEDTGWIDLNLSSGIEVVSIPRYRKKNGIVTIMGTIKVSSVSWNKEIGVIPNDFTPRQEIDIICRGIDNPQDAHIVIINEVGRIGYLSGVNKNTNGQNVTLNIYATYIQG